MDDPLLMRRPVTPRRDARGQPPAHLVETRRVLRSGGWLRLVTPNGEANLRPLLAASTGSRARAGVLPVLDQGHLSFFGRRHLQRLFDECGFRCRRMRMVGILRGLTALGRLPGLRRFVRHTLPTRLAQAATRPAGAASDVESRYRQLAEHIDHDIARRHSRLRSWTPCYYYHRAMKRLDSLPAWCEVGYDFDCLLQRV